MIIAIVILVFLLILGSGFFSASETALTGANEANLHKMAEDGNTKAQKAKQLRSDKDRLIGSILLGNNLFNIAASALATTIALNYFGQEGVAYATLVVTILVLIFGEVIPKTFAFQNPDKVALAVSPLWYILVRVTRPLTASIQFIAGGIMKLLGISEQGASLVEGRDALRGAIDLHHSEGSVVKADKDMLASILDLSELSVADVMVHRKNIKALDIALPAKKIIKQAAHSRHTRIPVWEGELENIIGIMHTKRLVGINPDTATHEDVKSILYKPMYVPETTSLSQMLRQFQQKQKHVSLVVDEYGELMGLVTMEDILEEIVGQIDDEHDQTNQGIRHYGNSKFIIDGKISVRDINRELNWKLPENQGNTIAGLVIEVSEKIPEEGETIAIGNLHIKVLKKSHQQIKSVEVKLS